MIVEHVVKRHFTCLIYHIPPISLEPEIIWFGASILLHLTIVHNGKYFMSNNLHEMGGICKKVWNWEFLVKFFLYDSRTWPRTSIYEWSSTACISLTIERVIVDIVWSPHGTKLLMEWDLNADLYRPNANAREKDTTAVLAAPVLKDMPS